MRQRILRCWLFDKDQPRFFDLSRRPCPTHKMCPAGRTPPPAHPPLPGERGDGQGRGSVGRLHHHTHTALRVASQHQARLDSMPALGNAVTPGY
jgi:hypothetical protein